jgi:hypothetical protein
MELITAGCERKEEENKEKKKVTKLGIRIKCAVTCKCKGLK